MLAGRMVTLSAARARTRSPTSVSLARPSRPSALTSASVRISAIISRPFWVMSGRVFGSAAGASAASLAPVFDPFVAGTASVK
jgi:hypothetical protein